MASNEQVDFDQAFVDKRLFQQKYAQVQTQRRVNVTAIYRERTQLTENRAVEMPKGVLEIRLFNLNNNYAEFLKEHKALLALIPQKDKQKIKENYAVQVERDYLQTAGELQELINDKDFLLKASQLRQLELNNLCQSKVAEMRTESSKQAENVLKTARLELNKIRAEKNTKEQQIKSHEPQASGSGTQVQKKPLQQLIDECCLNSDTELEDDAPQMTTDEIEQELKRYDSQENIHIVQSPRAEEMYVPTVKVNTLMVRPDVNQLPSTVEIVNPAEHNDLRHKLKEKRGPLHYKGADRSMPYRRERKWIPNRQISCFNCNGKHAMSKCQAFDELSISQRRQRVKELNLCENCFSPIVNEYGRPHICRFGICLRCRKAHHYSKLCAG